MYLSGDSSHMEDGSNSMNAAAIASPIVEPPTVTISDQPSDVNVSNQLPDSSIPDNNTVLRPDAPHPLDGEPLADNFTRVCSKFEHCKADENPSLNAL